MTRTACVSALLPAAGRAAIAAPHLGSRLRWSAPTLSASARARFLRVARVGAVASLAIALSLSLVGINGGSADWSPTMRIGILASIAIAVLLIRGARTSGSARR